jgi:cupin fold WbuC family metalloprotein
MPQKIKNFENTSEEILYPINSDIVSVSQSEVKQLIENSTHTARKRMRFCTHRNPSDDLHEMVIVHEKDTYVRPHKHLGRSESFHIIQGRCDIVLYEDDGTIREIVEMGDFNSGYNFYYRLNQNLFHTMIIYSEHLVFQETTLGPFEPESSLFAPWSPAANEIDKVEIFMKKILQDISFNTKNSKQ